MRVVPSVANTAISEVLTQLIKHLQPRRVLMTAKRAGVKPKRSAMRPNRHPGRCCECNVPVPVGSGTLAQRPDRWDHVCSGALCRQKVYGLQAPANPRVLRADGTIPLPKNCDERPLLEAIATWDQSAGVWRVTENVADRSLVLDLCHRMSVDTTYHCEWVNPRTTAVLRAHATCGGRHYQVDGTRWLALHERGLLADDMGLGKSKQMLDALPEDMGVLIVCPAIAKGVWQREIQKWRPDRFDSIVVCEGWGSFHWPRNARECVITNYDIVSPQKAELKNAALAIGNVLTEGRQWLDQQSTPADGQDRNWWTWSRRLWKMWRALYRLRDQGCGRAGRQWSTARAIIKNTPTIGKPPGGAKVCTVFDEVHKLKSNKALQTKRCRVLARYSARCYGLTGTPIENDPFEIWGVLTSIGCKPPQWADAGGWYRFLDAFGAVKKPHGGFDFDTDETDAIIVKPGTTELLRRVMLRRTKEDVGQDLPPVTFGEFPVPLTPALVASIEDIEPTIRQHLAEDKIPEIGAYAKVRKAIAASRIPTMLEIVKSYEESGTPLLVLSAHRAPILKLAKRKGWYAVTGDVASKKRTEYNDDFQRGKGFGFAGTFASMGVAITLTRAAHILIVDHPLTPSQLAQGIKRVDRIGQTENVHVTIMYSDHPLDVAVTEMLERKSKLIDRTLHGDFKL